MLWFVLTLRFGWELALLASVGWWGASQGGWLGVVLAAGLIVLTGTVWGLLLSPRAPVSLPFGLRLVVEVTIFFVAALALANLGHPLLGFVLLVGDLLILGALKLLQPDGAHLGGAPQQ